MLHAVGQQPQKPGLGKKGIIQINQLQYIVESDCVRCMELDLDQNMLCHTHRLRAQSWGNTNGLYPRTLSSPAWAHAVHLQRHLDEISRCLRWCIDRGKAYWPANTHTHLAPHDSSQFYYGVAPWFPDGTLNPFGVPPASDGAGVY